MMRATGIDKRGKTYDESASVRSKSYYAVRSRAGNGSSAECIDGG